MIGDLELLLQVVLNNAKPDSDGLSLGGNDITNENEKLNGGGVFSTLAPFFKKNPQAFTNPQLIYLPVLFMFLGRQCLQCF